MLPRPARFTLSCGSEVVLVERHGLTSGTTGRHHGLLHSGARYAVIAVMCSPSTVRTSSAIGWYGDTGDRLTDAQPGFDNQTNEPAVHLTLDGV